MSQTSLRKPRAAASPSPRALTDVSARARIEDLACSAEPLLVLEGVAQDVTPARLKKENPYRFTRYTRVGGMALNLSHEHEPGWPFAMRVQPGAQYRVTVFACKKQVKSTSELPRDSVVLGDGCIQSLTFFAIARDRSGQRDIADRRRVCKGHVAVWTDGVALTSDNTAHATSLVPDAAYKVVVELIGQPS